MAGNKPKIQCRVALVAWGASFDYNWHQFSVPSEAVYMMKQHRVSQVFIDARPYFPRDPGKGKGKGNKSKKRAAFECSDMRAIWNLASGF